MQSDNVKSSAMLVFFYVLLAGFNLVECAAKQSPEQIKELDSLCYELGSIKKLSQVEQLIDVLKKVMKDVNYIDYKKYSHWNDYWKRSIYHTRPCLMQANAIVDLEPIIGERANVCKSSHINKIEDYHRKYIKSIQSTASSHQKPITSNFFHLYAGQVAIICKQNLLQSLNNANDKLFDADSYAKFMPWLSEEGTCEANKIPETLQHGSERQCNARRALSSVKSVYELVDSLDKDQESMARMLAKLKEGNNKAVEGQLETDRQRSKIEFILMVPEHDKQPVKDVLKSCSDFRPIYENTVLPIVRLISLGIDPDFEKFDRKFDAKCREEKIVQRWFSITLVCNSMLKSRLSDSANDTGNGTPDVVNQHGLVIVDGKQEQAENDATNNEPPEFLSYPIEDELWVGKFMSSHLGRLKSSFIKNIVKTFKINELLNNVVYQKTVKNAKTFSITSILVVLTLMGIDGTLFLPA